MVVIKIKFNILKKILPLILLVEIIHVPVPVYSAEKNAFSGAKTSYSIEEHKKKNWLTSAYYTLKIDDEDAYLLSTGAGNLIGKATSFTNASTMDLLGLAASIISNASPDDYSLEFDKVSVTGIETAFNYWPKADNSANSSLGVLRDLCVGTAAKKIKENPDIIEDDRATADKLADSILVYYKEQYGKDLKSGGVSGVMYNDIGDFADYSSLESVLGSIVSNAVDHQANTANAEFLDGLKTEWDDNDIYDSTRRAILFLTDSSAEDNLKLAVIAGAEDYYGKDNTDKTKYIPEFNESSKRDNILNSIIWACIHNTGVFNNKAKNVALLSLVQERGSTLSYAKGGLINLSDDLQLPISTNNVQAQKEMSEIEREIDTVLQNSALGTQEQKRLYTLGLRMQYSYFAMQYSGDLEENTATQLSIDESSGSTLRTVDTIVPTYSLISNLQGYTMLNNVINELGWAADVTLPVLGAVTSEDEINSNVKEKLKYLRSAYDGVIFMRDKSGITPSSAVDSILEIWNKKVKVTVDGQESTTSLAETFDRINQFYDIDSLDFSNSIGTGKPMANFFDSKTKELSNSLKYGIALSASYIPFKTNVYEPITYKALVGNDDFFNFQVLYGYYRKPLMIDTNISSVSENFTSGRVGTLKLCTLSELLNAEKEITLYTDDNFYGLDQLEEYKSEAIQRYTDKTTEDTTGNVAERLIDKIKHANDIDLEQVLKTGENEKYPTKFKGLTQYEESKKDTSDDALDEVVLNGTDIDEYLGNGTDNEITDPSYNIMRSYAVTSSVARDSDLYSTVTNNSRLPVFKSSKNIAKVQEASIQWKSSIINYLLLKNAKANMNISYSSNIDLNKPVYMDVYGNILTESGYVVIPAASNATLNKTYEPYNAGFITTYGKSYSLPTSYSDFYKDSPIKELLGTSEDGETYEMRGTEGSNNEVIDLSSAVMSNEDSVDNLVNVYGEGIDNNFNIDLYISNVLMEVLRGAPLEFIDKTKEGIVVGNFIGDNGIVQAAKLENFSKFFVGDKGNAIVSIGNIAFAPLVEYVVPLLVKLALIVFVLVLLKLIFEIGMRRSYTFTDVRNFILSIILALFIIYALPTFFDFSYYKSNKYLLRDETLNVAMLNLEKRESGLEVGVQDVMEATSKSKFYLKMKDLNIEWFPILRDIATSPITKNLTAIYEEEAKNDLAFNAKDFTFKNGSLYIDADDLLDSTTVTFNPTYRSLYDVREAETPASFYTPYYVFLHGLTVDANLYNIENNIYSYSVQTYKDGKIKSLGLIKPYMESSVFQEDDDSNADILHLREIYGKDLADPESDSRFTGEVESIQKSNWVNTNIEDDDLNKRFAKMNRRAKKFISEHQTMLGRVSDETFLKMMSLDLSIYYNQLFNVKSADSLEVFNMSSEDLARFCIAPQSEVIEKSPLSFARFVYEEGGEISVYLATILISLFFLNSWISPIVVCFVFLAVFISVFVRKIVMAKDDGTEHLLGYSYIILYLGATCFGYAGLLKLSTLTVSAGFMTSVNILFLCIVHIIVILMMLFIGAVVIMNWRDLGAAQFSETTAKVGHVIKAIAGQGRRLTDSMGQGFAEGKDKLDDMVKKRKETKERNKKKNLFEYGNERDDVIDDSTVVGRDIARTNIRNQNIYKDTPPERTKYRYDGENNVTIINSEGQKDEISYEEFVSEYGFSPKVTTKKSLSDRVKDKQDRRN